MIISYNRDFWMEFSDLIRQQRYVAASDQCVDRKPVRPTTNHVKCAGTDGSSGAK
jgi:hypothetical protein